MYLLKSVLSVFPFCILFHILMVYQGRKAKESFRTVHFVWAYLLILYTSLVFSVTGSVTLEEAVRAVGKLPVMADISWIPFASGLTFPMVLNLVMFLPLGFLLPVLWDRFRSFGRVLTAGFLCSLVLELGQLFNFRATDLEDLLMNTAGAAAGFLLWLLLMKLLRIKIRWKGLRSGSFLVRHEMEFLMIFAFLGHFFLS
ncbi:MAG: VanZ family protein [Lachnospiraceae bacterium]|nr:VanZ family protein [Lachnospiraceae bacterium]